MEIVEDGVTGILIEPGNENEMADAIRRLALSPSLRQEMGQRGRCRAERDYSLPLILEKTDSVISSVIQGRGRS